MRRNGAESLWIAGFKSWQFAPLALVAQSLPDYVRVKISLDGRQCLIQLDLSHARLTCRRNVRIAIDGTIVAKEQQWLHDSLRDDQFGMRSAPA